MPLGYGAPDTSGPLQQGFLLKTGQPSLLQRLRLTQWLGNAKAPILADPSEIGTQGVPSSIDQRSPYEQFTGESSPNYGDFSSYKPPSPPPYVPGAAAVPGTVMADLGYKEDPTQAHALMGGFSRGQMEMTPPEKTQIDPTKGAEPISPNAGGHDHRMFFERNPNAGRNIGMAALGSVLGGLFGGDMSFAAGASRGLSQGINEQDRFNRAAQEEDLTRADQQKFSMSQMAEQAKQREQAAQADYMRGRTPTMYQGQELMLRPEDITTMGHQKALEDIERARVENATKDQLPLSYREALALSQIKAQLDPASLRQMRMFMPHLAGALGEDDPLTMRINKLIGGEAAGSPNMLEAVNHDLAGLQTNAQKLKYLHDHIAQLGQAAKNNPAKAREYLSLQQELGKRLAQVTTGQAR